MKSYLFNIIISGEGDNIDDAWDDAVDAFIDDPGPTPDDPKYIQEIPEDWKFSDQKVEPIGEIDRSVEDALDI